MYKKPVAMPHGPQRTPNTYHWSMDYPYHQQMSREEWREYMESSSYQYLPARLRDQRLRDHREFARLPAPPTPCQPYVAHVLVDGGRSLQCQPHMVHNLQQWHPTEGYTMMPLHTTER